MKGDRKHKGRANSKEQSIHPLLRASARRQNKNKKRGFSPKTLNALIDCTILPRPEGQAIHEGR